MASDISRLRLRLPNGAEFEAKGPAEFVKEQLGDFLERQNAFRAREEAEKPNRAREGATPSAPQADTIRIKWSSIIETQGQDIFLRAKLGNDKNEGDACLSNQLRPDGFRWRSCHGKRICQYKRSQWRTQLN